MQRMSLSALGVAVTLGILVTSFAAELQDPKKAPSGYVKVVKKGDKEEWVFDDTSSMYSPATLDQILSAYGLTLKDPKKAPPGYVKVVKKGDKEELVFDTTSLSYSPARLNQVLLAYGPTANAR
jgi:hypothetical protein